MNKVYDPTDINAHSRAEADRASAQRVAREQEAADYRWLMGSAQGRRIVRDLFRETQVNKDSFTGNSTTFYNEGKRAIGLYIEGKAKVHALNEYCLMLKEQQGNE